MSAADYYSQLTQKFLVEMSKAGTMVGAFDQAVIAQTAGQRPYATVYDTFYGDVTQQGIILDKYFAMQDFVALWQSSNYDQNQAGSYINKMQYKPKLGEEGHTGYYVDAVAIDYASGANTAATGQPSKP